jgi:anti-sigma factor RsiW
MFKDFAWRFLQWFYQHPGDSQILSFLHGELPDERRSFMVKHLDQCHRCHTRLMQLEQEWKHFAELNTASTATSSLEEKELIAKIQDALHDRPKSGPEMDRQLAAVLKIYLGQRAATALLQPGETAAASQQERLAGAEAALLTLLGRKGFAAVEMKLLKILESPKSANESSQS